MPINFVATCFSSGSQLLVYFCYNQKCVKLGYVSAYDTTFDVKIISPFLVGVTYTISIQSKDGYVVADSEDFTVKESCVCSPSIEITSSVEYCYISKDV